MPKLSIIIPVYNVEEYIDECVNSVLNQTLKDIEIIIVDDESPDKSIAKIENIQDDRIRIIKQKNKGLSGARNTGLKLAKGEYVTFVDSDDYIAFAEAYEEMYNLAINDKSDIVAGNCIWYYSKKNNYPMERDIDSFSNSPMKADEFYIKSLETYRTYAPVWLNIYRRSLLVENDIFFKDGVYHEDEEFMPKVLLKANTVSIYKKEFYIYRQRNGSIMNSGTNVKRCTDLLNVFLEVEKLLDGIDNIKLKKLLQTYIISRSLDMIYDNKFTNVSEEAKRMINDNANTKLFKLRSRALSHNVNSYIMLEKNIRLIKKVKGKI